jgi:hypothetical protein
VLCGGTLWIYKSSSNVSHIPYLSSPFHHSPLSLPPFLRVSIGIIFMFIYVHIQYLHKIHPPIPFPNHLPNHLLPPHWYQPPSLEYVIFCIIMIVYIVNLDVRRIYLIINYLLLFNLTLILFSEI